MRNTYRIVIKSQYIHFLVDEACYGLDSGDIRIDLEVSNCEGMVEGDAFSGWKSARSMIIMEVKSIQGITDRSKFCLDYIARSVIDSFDFSFC